MATTSTVVKSSTGTTISIYNNNVITSAVYYDTKFKIQKSVFYDAKGVVRETDTFSYDSLGKLVSESRYTGTGSLIETMKFTYNAKNQMDTTIHYDTTGAVTSTDYFVNGLLDHTTKAVTPTTSVGSWSTVSGYGSIDVFNALKDAIHKDIIDVQAPANINWALKSARFEDAWNAGYTGKGQTIAVLDSGIDLKNADLTKHLSKDSFNFVSNNTNVQDDFGHGTFVASEITAANNGDSITGGAYDADLMVLKTANNLGNATPQNVAKAIYYAVDHGADIISMSLNSVVDQPLLKAAFDYAKSHDVLVAVSAGNTLANKPSYPAIYAATNSDVVAVGATFNMNGKDVFNSVSGKAGSIAAYNYVDAGGTAVTGYDQFGKVVQMSGTSMATPLVASEMAILKQAIEQLGTYANNVICEMVMNYVTHDTHSLQVIGVQQFTAVDAFIV